MPYPTLSLPTTLLLSLLSLRLPLLAFAVGASSPSLVAPSTFGSATITSPAASSSATSSAANSSSASATSSAAYPSLSGYPTCVSNCLQLAVTAANCTSVIEVNCYCGSPSFAREIVLCIAGTPSCNTTLASTESLADEFCALATPNGASNISTSLTFPNTTILNPSTSSVSVSVSGSVPTPVTSTSTATAPSATKTSGARSVSVLAGMVGLSVVPALVITFW